VSTHKSDWSEVDGALERTFQCASFPAAVAFVNRIAELAEQENHHPDILLSYRKVTVRWVSHSAGGITDRDHVLAAATSEVFTTFDK
jgi:4a-hydroxytetrahydrobiopterin dehydratase